MKCHATILVLILAPSIFAGCNMSKTNCIDDYHYEEITQVILQHFGFSIKHVSMSLCEDRVNTKAKQRNVTILSESEKFRIIVGDFIQAF